MIGTLVLFFQQALCFIILIQSKEIEHKNTGRSLVANCVTFQNCHTSLFLVILASSSIKNPSSDFFFWNNFMDGHIKSSQVNLSPSPHRYLPPKERVLTDACNWSSDLYLNALTDSISDKKIHRIRQRDCKCTIIIHKIFEWQWSLIKNHNGGKFQNGLILIVRAGKT